ncbi:MAG: hypothetical protein JSV12_04290 [Candidatus Bathyarchaeota archaeon]|nr:MAG: hypothetical protein JSV12_04290 [Candidatus Bathyarchaeota archaeon]
MYKCSKCGYYGAAVIEFDDDTLRKMKKAEKMRKKLRPAERKASKIKIKEKSFHHVALNV